MSAATELLLDGYSRIRQAVHRAGEGLSAEELAVRLDPDANSIGWLLWHLTRVQDDHVAGVAGREELWTEVWRKPLPPVNNTIAVHIRRLRHKLGDSEAQPRFIHTVRGIGYRLDTANDG